MAPADQDRMIGRSLPLPLVFPDELPFGLRCQRRADLVAVQVRRSGGVRGIWYSHFSLYPQTMAAEILRLAGRDLYDWQSPDGHTLRQAFEPLAGWTREPTSFPYWDGEPSRLAGVTYFSYFEILHAHWPNDDAAALLSESRPMTARHSAPVLTFTHGDLLADRPGS